jgi:hypothetical protein
MKKVIKWILVVLLVIFFINRFCGFRIYLWGTGFTNTRYEFATWKNEEEVILAEVKSHYKVPFVSLNPFGNSYDYKWDFNIVKINLITKKQETLFGKRNALIDGIAYDADLNCVYFGMKKQTRPFDSRPDKIYKLSLGSRRVEVLCNGFNPILSPDKSMLLINYYWLFWGQEERERNRPSVYFLSNNQTVPVLPVFPHYIWNEHSELLCFYSETNLLTEMVSHGYSIADVRKKIGVDETHVFSIQDLETLGITLSTIVYNPETREISDYQGNGTFFTALSSDGVYYSDERYIRLFRNGEIVADLGAYSYLVNRDFSKNGKKILFKKVVDSVNEGWYIYDLSNNKTELLIKSREWFDHNEKHYVFLP